VSFAKYKFNLQEFDSSKFYFENAFKSVNYVYGEDYFFYSICLSKLNEYDKSYYYLQKAITQGVSLIFIENDSAFNFLNFTQKNELKSIETKFNAFTNNELKNLTDSGRYYMFNEQFYFENSMNKKIALEFGAKYIDSSIRTYSNFETRFINYISKYGWIDIRTTGRDYFETAGAHLSTEKQKNFLLPLLKNELLKGNTTPDSYGFILEHFNILHEIELSNQNTECFLFIIKTDCNESQYESIIKNRNEIGLSIYLNQGDYILYQRYNRSEFKWVKKNK
jgi:hypothetical protein